jgi:UDP-N-acetylglucosamine acyltransferase
MARIHATAVISPRAELDSDVDIGPFVVIEAGVRIGAGTRILAHAVLAGRTTIGARNVIHPFAVVGGEPQIKKFGVAVGTAAGGIEKRGGLVIGDDNVIREHVTINVSSDEAPTRIGSNNLLMAGCHVAHDVIVGSRCVIANAVQLAGHVVIEDWATFGGAAAVAQFVRVGESAFVAGGAMCERDVPPFVIVQGDRARVRALNVVGLERRGVPSDSVAALKRAFAALYTNRNTSFADAVRALDRSDPFVAQLATALA